MQVNENAHFNGQLSCRTIALPVASVGSQHILGFLAADVLGRPRKIVYSQRTTSDFADDERTLFTADAPATVVSFKAGAITVAGASTSVSVDLKKNGTTILSAPIVLDNSQTARQKVAATISSAALVADDVLEVHMALTGTNEPKGVFVELQINENPE